ncbi:hypothetical protein [Pelosinus sp. UFO1]|uniref:hypothetical protein n=1 Tax=Pelosinus sp. UFO1 TaxID=484770 RepID=UPI0004D145EA|nr:hypothetical protein [Pelosinus sp. UFO1]AIF51872.1 hypothetical protein UFO1_2325 [Pelosinus sp. UFO1]
MKKQAAWLILTMILASNIVIDCNKDVAFSNSKTQENANWSESVGSSSINNVQEFNTPIYKTVHNIMTFLEKRNLDVISQDGRFILFYKVK